MTKIIVSGNTLSFNGKSYRCAIGKNGFSTDKKEGDNCTPIGVFNLRECWYRADKISAQKTALPLKVIHRDDGWCDDPKSTAYNQHIKLLEPSPSGGGYGEGCYSYEILWRNDDVYDLIIPLGYNDAPIIPGKGSAIFMHVARANYEETEGCVALAKNDFLEILAMLPENAQIEIRGS